MIALDEVYGSEGWAETEDTPRWTWDYIETKGKPEATYLHHRRATLHKHTCQVGSLLLAGRLSRFHQSPDQERWKVTLTRMLRKEGFGGLLR